MLDTLDKLIAELTRVREKHGDLPVLGGAMVDDTPPRDVHVLNDRDEEIRADEPPQGVFIE